MISKQGGPDKYSDLLDKNADPGTVRLVSDLDTLFNNAEPTADIEASIAATLQTRAAVGGHERRSYRGQAWLGAWATRFAAFPKQLRAVGMVATVLVVMGMLAGSASALLPILEQAFGMSSRTREIVLKDLGKEVNISSTSGGFTMTVERVYADHKQVVVGYTVKGPAGRVFNNFSLVTGTQGSTLRDEEGKEFEPTLGFGAGVEGDTGGYVTIYEGAIKEDAKEIKLTLEVPALIAIEAVNPDKPERAMATPAARDVDASGSTAVMAQPVNTECSKEYRDICFITVPGPFTFNFTVPVENDGIGDVRDEFR